MSAFFGAAGAILEGIAHMVADWMRSVAMDAIITAASAVIGGMACVLRCF
jgi:hypothetical protein